VGIQFPRLSKGTKNEVSPEEKTAAAIKKQFLR